MDSRDCLHLRPISRPVDKTVHLPGSKSLTNRALLVAALAKGESRIDGLLLAEDTELMLDALRALGISVRLDRDVPGALVRGGGGHWPNGEADLFCGNAGTVLRFLAAACCIGHGDYRLDGVARLRERPIGELVNALCDLGARIGYEGREGCCPLTISGRGLRGGVVRFERLPSSQFVSAVLMAAPYAASDVLLDAGAGLPSEPYVVMTLRVMEAFGVSVVADGNRRFVVPARQTYMATRYQVEPDASAASYFFAAAALTGGRITVENLGRRSCQGDLGFVSVLERMGCRIEQNETSTTVWGSPGGKLRGVEVDLNAMPDVAPTLAVLAAFANGPTHIRNVASLRVKETDRLAALAVELGRLGIQTQVDDDGIEIRPGPGPRGALIETYGDHRIAMSFALAGLRVKGVAIGNPDCVTKTFPGFFEQWAGLVPEPGGQPPGVRSG